MLLHLSLDIIYYFINAVEGLQTSVLGLRNGFAGGHLAPCDHVFKLINDRACVRVQATFSACQSEQRFQSFRLYLSLVFGQLSQLCVKIFENIQQGVKLGNSLNCLSVDIECLNLAFDAISKDLGEHPFNVWN